MTPPPPGGPPRLDRQEARQADAEVVEMAPGILRIQLPIMLPGLGHVNCYALEDNSGVTLVDPGLPGPTSWAVLNERLTGAGIPPDRVHTTLVTHSHPDHFGGAGRLRLECGTTVVAHRRFRSVFDPEADDDRPLNDGQGDEAGTHFPDALDRPPLGSSGRGPSGSSGKVDLAGFMERVLFSEGPVPDLPPRRTTWGGIGYTPSDPEIQMMRAWDPVSKRGFLTPAPDLRVDDGDLLELGGRQWRAIHTPGHTGDHICLFDPDDGILLAGDHVLPTITPHVAGGAVDADTLAQFLASQQRVAELPGVRLVLPAHGLPFHDLPGRLAEIRAHHVERLDRLVEAGTRLGEASVTALSHELFAPRSWGPMAESETFAHLEHLHLLGRCHRRWIHDQLHYLIEG